MLPDSGRVDDGDAACPRRSQLCLRSRHGRDFVVLRLPYQLCGSRNARRPFALAGPTRPPSLSTDTHADALPVARLGALDDDE